MTTEMDTKALAPWFGAGRTIAAHVGEELRGCCWVGVPFAGGMSELAEIDARSMVVNDKHRHVINLASVVATRRRELFSILKRLPFSQDVLYEAQQFCKTVEPSGLDDVSAAANYFVCVWMGRSHKAGTTDEFNGKISRRWNANGGDSNTRYRSALRSLAAWERIMRRCNFDTIDAFDFLEKCEDVDGHGLYIDAPWPDDGKKYRFTFTEAQQKQLAERLREFKLSRVVIRYGDHPLIRKLYPQKSWTWRHVSGRTQTNDEKSEVLIINGPSYAEDDRSDSTLF